MMFDHCSLLVIKNPAHDPSLILHSLSPFSYWCECASASTRYKTEYNGAAPDVISECDYQNV